MKIVAIQNTTEFVDRGGKLTPVWGRFIAGLQSNLAGEWGIQKNGDTVFQLMGPVMHINIKLGAVTNPANIALPVSCIDGPIYATDNNIVLTNSVKVVGNEIVIPADTYTNLHISGTAIVAQTGV